MRVVTQPRPSPNVGSGRAPGPPALAGAGPAAMPTASATSASRFTARSLPVSAAVPRRGAIRLPLLVNPQGVIVEVRGRRRSPVLAVVAAAAAAALLVGL